MVKQMLFMDAPAHTRLRGLASKAFTPARVEQLRAHIQDIVERAARWIRGQTGEMDVIARFRRAAAGDRDRGNAGRSRPAITPS